MVSRRQATVSSAVANGVNAVIVAAQSIVLLPLFLRLIGKALYGAWAGVGDVLLWMQSFDLGLPNLMGQRIGAAHGRGDDASVGRWLATGMVALGVVASLLVGFATGFADFLPRLFSGLAASGRASIVGAFSLSSIGIGLAMMNSGALAYARAVQRPSALNFAMTVSSLVNLGVTLVFLLRGAGLYAIAYGVLARSGLLSLASVSFLIAESRRGLRSHFRFDRAVFVEAMRLMPATLLGGLAYAALNQSELLILNVTVGALAAASFLAIRRASELVRALSDSIAISSYASFAHLVAGPERSRAHQVLQELTDMRSAASVVMLAPYLAVNSSFVAVWVKGQVVPDPLLTLAIAAQTFVIGGAFLANYLFRASGEVMLGSVLLAVEAVVRVAAMYGFSRAFGPIGVPIGAMITALPVWYLTDRALRQQFESETPDRKIEPNPWRGRPATRPWRSWAVRGAILASSGAFGFFAMHASWAFVGLVGTGTVIGASAALLHTESTLSPIRKRLSLALRRKAP